MDFCHGSRVENVSLLIKSVIMNDFYYVKHLLCFFFFKFAGYTCW